MIRAIFFFLLLPLLGHSFTLEQKIGQMIMVGFRGFALTEEDPLYQQIERGQIGGVILFDYDTENQEFVRNIRSPDQLKALCSSLQDASKIPLLISVDQEGGKVNRLKPEYGFPAAVSQQCLAEKNDLPATFQQGASTGHTLVQMGINLNLAPVVDLNVNPSSPGIGKKGRSFSANPDIVTTQARALIRGHHSVGALTTLKHFPGHGSAALDTHDGFVDVTNTWSEVELVPFTQLIASDDADVIMTAHVFNQKLDAQVPLSLSHSVISGLLRRKLGFKGVIITDDLQMKAIRLYYPLEESVRLAIEAGTDILLFANHECYDIEIAPKVIEIIKHLVATGQISPDRIDESFYRIQILKAQAKTQLVDLDVMRKM